MATAYMHEYGADRNAFFDVAIKNHKNGALNDKAQFEQTIEQIMEAKKARAVKKGRPEPTWKTDLEFLQDPKGNPNIAWPMTLFDCSPVSDGAAMVLLVSEDLAKAFSDSPLYLIGSGQASDGALPERETLPASRQPKSRQTGL